MTGLRQAHLLLVRQYRLRCIHLGGQRRAGKNEGQIGNVQIVQRDGMGNLRTGGGHLRKDTLNFMGLVTFQGAELVVGIHHRHRFHKQGGTGSRRIVDQALDLVPIFSLNGNNETAASGCNDILLQKLAHRSAAGIFLQKILNLTVHRTDLATDFRQSRAGFIGNHILRRDGTENPLLKQPVGNQSIKNLIQNRCEIPLPAAVIRQHTGTAKHTGYIQEFSRAEGSPLLCPLKGSAYVFHPTEGRHSFQGNQTFCIGGAGETPTDRIRIVVRQKRCGFCLRALGGCQRHQPIAYFIKLQRAECFFIKTHCFSFWVNAHKRDL